MRSASLTIIAFVLVCAAAGDARGSDATMLENLRRMRVKQQDEEFVVRAQIWKNVQTQPTCTPVQQTRVRLREIGGGNSNGDNDVVINAGTEELNVTDNHGTINSDVNVQIIKQGDDNPCP